ncbi:aldehyde dehydrogenase [Marinomonas ushuaiensis DSM 15871]|uniref:Aldehyde dehydrogenase n=1 Tax=Marinomonas ushuaiensis DSM 15871 TaxID=1122207 RepID=X7E7V3_9GAMM|nr:aldehyde dehydrogenase [Marinomonas ushuaiensis]ETX11895.1 aldehyde dehydrogenase [Marinomonas ushuaiensis DSM 15871]
MKKNNVPTHQNFINGEFCHTDVHIEVRNPSTEALISYSPSSSQSDVDSAVDAARKAQLSWSRKPAIERAGYLKEIAAKIREHVPRLAKVISEEQGKVLPLAEVEVNFTADYLDYMAEWARRIEGEVITSDRENENIFLLRKPVGVVAGILPWNFPFFLIARKMAPALVTGNTIVIKPSEETPNNCHEFTKLLAETSLPKGVFNLVCGTGQVGAQLSESPNVDMISFTGSVSTGEKIMAAAAKNITKVNLELGGKAPAIVLDDADLDLAVKAICDSRVINSGQVCNCTERVYVQSGIADEFIKRMTEQMEQVTYGDPLQTKDVVMGPIINETSLKKIAQSVETAIKQGAKLECGGKVAELGKGHFFQPTVLSHCDMSMTIMRKETFGPVLPIQVVESLDEAITHANDCEYGLTSSIYTRDLSKAMQAMRELNFGETYINRENFEAMQGFHAGVKKSGIGGADGKHGLYEYTSTHVVYIQS